MEVSTLKNTKTPKITKMQVIPVAGYDSYLISVELMVPILLEIS